MNALRKFAETSPDAACIRLHSQNRLEMQKMRKSCAGNALVMRVECAGMHFAEKRSFFTAQDKWERGLAAPAFADAVPLTIPETYT